MPIGINTVISVNDTNTIKMPDQKFILMLPLLTKPCKDLIVMSISKQRSQVYKKTTKTGQKTDN